MTMRDWEERLDTFLRFNERELLTHAGQLSAEVATELARERFDEFDAARRLRERQEADEEDRQAVEDLRKRLPPPTGKPPE